MSASDWEYSSGSSGSNVSLSPNDSSCIHIPVGVPVHGLETQTDSQCSSLVAYSGFGVNCCGPVEGGVPRSLLKDGNPQSTTSSESLDRLRYRYNIPPHVSLIAPSILERPDWTYPRWTIMYECFFTMGARLPLPRLILEACDYFCISPSQLMPNTWRTLMAIQVFSELRNVHFSIYEVLLAYNLEKHKTDKVRYQLKATRPLILTPIDSARGWKLKYFFVPFDALGVPNGSEVQESWQICVRLTRKLPVPSKSSLEKISWFLGFNEEERQYSTILTPANLRTSSLWKQVPTSCVMSKPFYPPLLKEGAMKKFRLRKKTATTDSSSEMRDEAVEVIPPVSAQTRRSKRRAQIDPTDQYGVTIDLSFSSDIAAHSEFSKCHSEVEKLLFLNDRDLLEHMGNQDVATALFDDKFMQLQKAIFLKEKIVQMATELKELKDESARWHTEMGAVKKAYDDAGGVIKRLEVARAEDARRSAAECQALQERVRQLEDRVVDVSCDTEIITRGMMAKEFLKIKPPQTWDVTQYLAEFEEWKKENPDWVAQFERHHEEQDKELAANFAGMSTGGLQLVNLPTQE